MLQLLRDVIAVIPLDDPDKVGSLYVPDQAKQKTDQGIVLYRGPKCKDVRIGDHVFFGSYVGTKVTLDPYGELIFMREVDVAFYDDGKPPEVLIPYAKLMQLLDQAVGELLYGSELDRSAVEKVGEQLKHYIVNRTARGLEF